MYLLSKIVLFVLTAPSIYVAALNSAEAPQNQIDFLKFLNTTEFKNVIFFNSTTCKKCAETLPALIQKITNFQISKDNFIETIFIDTNQIPDLRFAFEFPTRIGLTFFFRIDSFVYPDFNRVYRQLLNKDITEDDFEDALENFLYPKLKQYSQELIELVQITEAVKQHKTIALYIGYENYDYEMFIRFAYLSPDINFYHIFDPDMGEAFLSANGYKDSFADSAMLIVRDDSILNEFEMSRTSMFKGVRNFIYAKRFLEFEKLPKLRKETEFEEIAFNLFAHHDKMLIYVGAANFHDSSSFGEFKNAITLLPKRMVYTYTSPDLENFAYVMNLFTLGSATVGVENVYLVHLVNDSHLEILSMRKSLNKENIIGFVFEFFEKQKGKISDVEFIDLSIVKRKKLEAAAD